MGVLWLVFACWASCEVDELSSKGLASGREFDFADGCGGSGDILASSSNRDALFFAAGVFFSSAELAGSFAGLLAGFERFPELMLVFCSYAYAMTSMGVVNSAGRGWSCFFAARRDIIHGSPEPFLLSLVSGNVSSPGHARGVGETHAGQTGPPQGGGSALPKLQHRA